MTEADQDVRIQHALEIGRENTREVLDAHLVSFGENGPRNKRTATAYREELAIIDQAIADHKERMGA